MAVCKPALPEGRMYGRAAAPPIRPPPPNSKRHHMLAQALIEYETLTGDECRDIVNKGKMPKRKKENVEDGAKGDQSILGKGFGIKGSVKG